MSKAKAACSNFDAGIAPAVVFFHLPNHFGSVFHASVASVLFECHYTCDAVIFLLLFEPPLMLRMLLLQLIGFKNAN
jgi:hypothetical protein